MSDDEKATHDGEYQELLAIFINFLKNINSDNREEAMLAFMELRADFAIQHAFKGFGVDVEEALQLLKDVDDNNLTKQDIDKRDRIVAAVNNLIEFSVCEEYQVSEEATTLYQSHIAEDENYSIDFNDSDDYDEYLSICERYNDTYAAVENSDIEYAMSIAHKWTQIGSNENLTYWTMNDARVRPWHLALQGYTAKRDEFPSWMIPPIEWHCRCFLLSDSMDEEVTGNLKVKKVFAKAPAKPTQIDDVFSESVAKCGRIFGKSHSYFSVKEKDKGFLQDCVNTIKKKYYGR